jgi:tRNA uridine 5-carbamoylmethylation protein Kti12
VQDGLLAEDNNDTGTQNISLLKGRYKLVIVPSHDSSHPRTVYDNARTEKEARGVAFARIKRALTRDTIVVADGMNYIKGWRYQLWCEAKSVGTTCCVVSISYPSIITIYYYSLHAYPLFYNFFLNLIPIFGEKNPCNGRFLRSKLGLLPKNVPPSMKPVFDVVSSKKLQIIIA